MVEDATTRLAPQEECHRTILLRLTDTIHEWSGKVWSAALDNVLTRLAHYPTPSAGSRGFIRADTVRCRLSSVGLRVWWPYVGSILTRRHRDYCLRRAKHYDNGMVSSASVNQGSTLALGRRGQRYNNDRSWREIMLWFGKAYASYHYRIELHE